MFESVYTCDAIDNEYYSVTNGFLKTLLLFGFPQSSMKLKVGVTVILLCNINNIEDICNETNRIVTWFYQNCIRAQIIKVSFNGKDYLIVQIKLSTKEDELLST